MRILWLTDFYAPHIGGLERHVQMVAGELASRGHDVSVATIWHDGTPRYERSGSVNVYRMVGMLHKFPGLHSDFRRKFHPTAPDPLITNEIWKIIKREKPQIVVSSGWILYSFLPLKAFSNVKLIVRHHDYAYVCPKRTLFYKAEKTCSGPEFFKCYRCCSDHYGLIKGPVINSTFRIFRHLHSLVDYHLPISKFVGEAININNQISRESIDVVPAPVPDEIFDTSPSKSFPDGIPSNEQYILYVGALTKHKGLQVLLDAYQGLENRANLILIGTEWTDSPANYPENVTVIKNAPHDFVMKAFSHCLFSVVPSIWPEPFGQVAVEAMAAYKPVIASAHGGLLDIVVDRKTGILVEPGNRMRLHQAMRRFLDDESLRTQFGLAGHARAKRLFACSQVTNQIEMRLERVIQK